MSIEEENKEVARRYMEEAFNNGNLAVVPEVVAPEYVHHTNFGEVKGAEGLKQTITIMRNAFPDLNYVIDSMVAEGNMVAFTLRAQGTFEGEFFGMSPTGNPFTYTEAVFMRLAGGKIEESWSYNDSSAWFKQLGVTPPVSKYAAA
jgi:steroid delta-isomerase-like uncharacterized protein